jgi:hypothetical protein
MIKNDVLQFPADRTGHPAREGATVFDVARSRIRTTVGRMANRLGLPGTIRVVDIHDATAGHRVTVTIGVNVLRLTVNGRDFYFDRLTGRYEGSGSLTC